MQEVTRETMDRESQYKDEPELINLKKLKYGKGFPTA